MKVNRNNELDSIILQRLEAGNILKLFFCKIKENDADSSDEDKDI
jgi:hypothetical protein